MTPTIYIKKYLDLNKYIQKIVAIDINIDISIFSLSTISKISISG